MNRNQLSDFLKHYSPVGEEGDFITPFLDLLQVPTAYHRTHLPGHFTASAWVISNDYHVALVHHRKLQRWLQPGGHADGQEDLELVARKEVHEETGICPGPGIAFDLDIHAIPASSALPEHLHYDVRFMFKLNNRPDLICSEESTEVRWFPLAQVGGITRNEPGILRMLGKSMVMI